MSLRYHKSMLARHWRTMYLCGQQPVACYENGLNFDDGYPCSPTVDERGLPTWIIVGGKQAQRREKQGDAWYSVRLADGTYAQVLRIPKGEKPAEFKGL